MVWNDTPDTRAWIERKDKKVVLVLGAPEKLSGKLRGEVWKAIK
jgi:hypothetical protein